MLRHSDTVPMLEIERATAGTADRSRARDGNGEKRNAMEGWASGNRAVGVSRTMLAAMATGGVDSRDSQARKRGAGVKPVVKISYHIS